MLDTLVQLVMESLILERLSEAERRVRRSRSMGIELEFASDTSQDDITVILNQQLRRSGAKVFGGKLKFTRESGEKEQTGISRDIVVTNDPTAQFDAKEEKIYDKLEEISRQMAHEVVSSRRELSRELEQGKKGDATSDQQDEYEESIRDLLDILNNSNDAEVLSGLALVLPQNEENIEQFKDYVSGLEYDAGGERPEFDEDEVSQWVLDLDADEREEVARIIGAESEDLLPVGHGSRTSAPAERSEWGDLTARYIENRFGREQAQNFRKHDQYLISNKEAIWHGLLVYLQYSRPKEVFNDLKPLDYGVEIVSPRIELSTSGIAEASKLFETIWKTLLGQDQIKIIAHEEAGLHVHLGIGDDVKDIHILRLYYYLAQHENAFEKAAGRAANEWAQSLGAWKKLIDEGAAKALKSKDPNELEEVLSDLGTKADKYFLANLKTIRTKGTIEVRLGAASLVETGRLKRWLTLLAKTHNRALKEDFLTLDSGVRLVIEGRKIQLQLPVSGGKYKTAVETSPRYALYGLDRGDAGQRTVADIRTSDDPGGWIAGQRKFTASKGEPLTRRREGHQLEQGRHKEGIAKQRQAGLSKDRQRREVKRQRSQEARRRQTMFGESVAFQANVKKLFG